MRKFFPVPFLLLLIGIVCLLAFLKLMYMKFAPDGFTPEVISRGSPEVQSAKKTLFYVTAFLLPLPFVLFFGILAVNGIRRFLRWLRDVGFKGQKGLK